MSICYLILAHANPRHLSRLAEVLLADGAAVHVHVDRKSDAVDLAALAAQGAAVESRRLPVH